MDGPAEPVKGESFNWFALASLVCGVFGLLLTLTGFFAYIGAFFCAAAIALGIVGRRDARQIGGEVVALIGPLAGTAGLLLVAVETLVAVSAHS